MELNRLLEIAAQRAVCDFCADCGDDACIACQKVKGVTATELREYHIAVRAALRKAAEYDKAREEGRTRGAELVRAESLIGNRLYVCWRGDTADQVQIRGISAVCITGDGKIGLEDGPYDGFVCYLDEIGKWDDDKYVGLTRAEAEAALGGGEGG